MHSIWNTNKLNIRNINNLFLFNRSELFNSLNNSKKFSNVTPSKLKWRRDFCTLNIYENNEINLESNIFFRNNILISSVSQMENKLENRLVNRRFHTSSIALSRKFEKIKGKKLISDVKKTVIQSKISREIQAAVSSAKSDDPEVNIRLKLALDNAKKNSVPKAVIDKAIQNGLQDKSIDTMEIIWYAGRVSRVCIMVRALADRTKRQVTTHYLKHIITKNGGTVGEPKSVEFAFKRKGLFVFPKDTDIDKLTEDCIELNVEDIFVNYEGNIVCLCNPNDYFQVKHQLEQLNYKEFLENDIVMYPIEESMEEVQVGTELGEQLSELVDSLEDHEDVQAVFTNIKWIFPEE